jgi:hypothetical protein
MTVNYPYINYPNPNTYTTSVSYPERTDPKLLEVLERIADALEELAY